MTIDKRDLESMDNEIENAAQKREKEVENATGGAPNYNKGLGHYVSTAHTKYFGRNEIKDIFGVGEESDRGADHPSVMKSINFGDRKSHRHVPEEVSHELFQLKSLIHSAQLQAFLLSRKSGMPIAMDTVPFFKAHVFPKLKAYNLTDWAAWVPQVQARFYFEEFEIALGLEAYFETVKMNSRVEQVPGALGRIFGMLESDDATFTEQSQVPGSYVWTAQDCVAHVKVTEDLLQDAMPQTFDRYRKSCMMGVQRSKERSIINGDDTVGGGSPHQGGAHMDADVAAASSKDFRKAFKGLRKIALDNAANGSVFNNQGNVFGLDTIRGMVRLAGTMAKDKADLLWVLGSSVGNHIVTGGIPEIMTVQNVGGQATLVNGSMWPIFGIKPYESEYVREDVSATGVNTAPANNLTTSQLIKRSRFLLGQRAPVKIWATPTLANQDALMMTAKERFSFAATPQSDKEKSCILAVNIKPY